MAAKLHTRWDFEPRILRGGLPAKRAGTWLRAEYCPVDVCERCRKVGSVTWVRKWWQQPPERNWRIVQHEPVLCMGCLNVLRPSWRTQHAIRACETLINRIKKEARRVKA